MNESATNKDKDIKTKGNTELGFEVYEPDTTLVTKNGKEYLKVLNPHPYIDYIKIGEKDYYKIVLRKDIPQEAKLTQKDEIDLIKKMVNFNDDLDSLAFNEFMGCRVFHKGVRVMNFDFNNHAHIYNIVYKSIDLNVKDVISKDDAKTIARKKVIDMGHKIASKLEKEKYLDKIKEINPNSRYHKLDTAIKFQIRKINEKLTPCYIFKIYNSKFTRNPIFTINANNGKIELIDDDSVRNCKICNDNLIQDSDCSLTHPLNDEPELLPCEIPTEIYKFGKFPDIYDGCSSVDSDFNVCANQVNEIIFISDIDSKVNAVTGGDFFPNHYYKNNASFDEIEVQVLTAFKNTERIFNYYTSRLSNLDDAIPNVYFTVADATDSNAEVNFEQIRILFGDGSDEGCLPNVSPHVVSHEFTHLVQRLHYNMIPSSNDGMFDALRAGALEEALCDIMAVLFHFSQNSSFDWSLFDETCPDDKSFRLLNDPINSDPPQRISYEFNFDKFDKYYWAGIISYWFYLVAEPEYKEVGNIAIGNGIGGVKAEQLMLGIFEKIKESIASNQNPLDNKSFNGIVNFIEFRDVALVTAHELYNGNLSYNLCSAEYTKIYSAFKAVGLIEEDLELPYNIVYYGETLIEDCPDFEQYFCSDESNGKSSLTTGFPQNFSNPNDTYWIQVAVDFNNNGVYEENEFITDNEAFTNDIVNHKTTVGGLPNKDTNVGIFVTNITTLKNDEILGEVSLPFLQYQFACNNGCNLITDIYNTGYVNETPPVNTGNININIDKDIEICAGSYFCIDYEVNAPAFVNVKINSDKFTKHITQSGTTNIGQFCWQPSIDDLGIYNFSILASDEHPVEPLFNTETINVNVKTYNTFGCGCAGTYPAETVNLDNAIASGHYVALENLESSGKLYSTADIIFKGGESVSLNNGFYAPASTNFEAYIANCPVFPIPNSEDP